MDKSRFKTLLLGSFLLLLCLIIGFTKSLSNSITSIQSLGVGSEITYLLLILPFLGFFLAFFRIIIGLSISNSFIPLSLVITCFFLGPLATFLLFLASLLFGYFTKYLVGELKLHFSVKTSIILSAVTLVLILILPYVIKETLSGVNNKPLLVFYGILLATLINEKFFSFKLTKLSLLADLKVFLQTILFIGVTYYLLGGNIGHVAQFTYLKTFIELYPESTLLALLFTILIGRYTGLRLTEIYRFRKLIFKNN